MKIARIRPKKIMFELLLLVLFLVLISCCQRSLSLQENIDIDYIRENFDWRAFIELYPECLSQGVNNEEGAIQYYIKYHHSKNPYHYPHRFPTSESLENALTKLSSYERLLNLHSYPPANRTLIIYHVGWLVTENSFDVTINNVKLFVNAILDDSVTSSPVPRAFYWINLIGGKENLLYKYLPQVDFLQFFQNIAILEWNISPSDMYTHFRTLELLAKKNFFQINNLTAADNKQQQNVHELDYSSFSTIIFLNNEARGPLIHREHGNWIHSFQDLLAYKRNVLVGSILSCEVKPHIQTHTFAIKSTFIPYILQQYRYGEVYKMKYWRYVVKHYEIGLSNLAITNNFTIGSILYQLKQNNLSFHGKCLIRERRSGFIIDSNPIRWCKLPMKDVIFMKWGGSPFRKTGFVCPAVKLQMDELLKNISQEYYERYDRLRSLPVRSKQFDDSHQMQIIKRNQSFYLQLRDAALNHNFKLQTQFTTPETLRGGALFDLYKQYDTERSLPENPRSTSKEEIVSSSSVCLFTNVYGNLLFHLPKRKELSEHAKKSKEPWDDLFVINFMKAEFDLFIQSLNRQVDANWMAYIISSNVTYPPRNTVSENDEKSEFWEDRTLNYDVIMQHFFYYVNSFHHPRIKFIILPDKREYKSVLEVYDSMLLALQHNSTIMSHCEWIIFSSIFNKFGSQVMSNLRTVQPISSEGNPSMVILPMDSKRFTYQDLSNRILPFWNLHCLHYLSFMNTHPSGYFAQFLPSSEQIDIAAVAFPLKSLLQEKLVFDNFTQFGYRNYLKVSSLNLFDIALQKKKNVPAEKVSPHSHLFYDPIYEEMMISSHFIQYLTRYRRWDYKRLALDGLKSMIVDVDAPTYCLASGNVWYDHPVVALAGCYTPSQVDRLHLVDLKNRKIGFSFDWKEFERNNRMCLRLNKDLYYQTISSYPNLKRFIPAKFRSKQSQQSSSSSSKNETNISSEPDAAENEIEAMLDIVNFDSPNRKEKSPRWFNNDLNGEMKHIQARPVIDPNNPEESRKAHEQYDQLKDHTALFQSVKRKDDHH